MNQTLITSCNGKSVFLIGSQNISFYICIPRVPNASIVLNIVEDNDAINMNVSNITSITNEINNIYSKFNDDGIAVVTPVLDMKVIEQLKNANNDSIYSYMDKFMGVLINSSYSVLKTQNIVVNKVIKLNDNLVFETFNKWFVARYGGRIELVNYNIPVSNALPDDSNTPSFTNQEVLPEVSIANAVLEDTANIDILEKKDANSEISRVSNKEPGFVSYVLLGVIVAVLSLVMLYFLL